MESAGRGSWADMRQLGEKQASWTGAGKQPEEPCGVGGWSRVECGPRATHICCAPHGCFDLDISWILTYFVLLSPLIICLPGKDAILQGPQLAGMVRGLDSGARLVGFDFQPRNFLALGQEV